MNRLLTLMVVLILTGCQRERESGVSAPMIKEWSVRMEQRLTALESAPGRFQIISGTILSDARAKPLIVKIDTTTGDTWELVETSITIKGAGGPSYVTGWNRINDDFGATIIKLQGSSLTNTTGTKLDLQPAE